MARTNAQTVAVVTGPYGGEERVFVRKGQFRGQVAWKFYAPGWKPMVFGTEAAAVAKVQRHPNFVRMEAA